MVLNYRAIDLVLSDTEVNFHLMELKLRAEEENSWSDEEKLRQQRWLREMEELSP